LALIRAFDPALERFRKTKPESDTIKESWGPNWLDPRMLGTIHRLSVFVPLQEQIEWLNGLGEVYLNTFASNAIALARHVKRGGARPKLLAVLTAGEPVMTGARHEIETALGCPCFDIVSNAELGMIACECPSHQGYHLQNELVRIELLDERNRPVKEGQWGRVVATPLYNFAMPLIRYDTGDWAKLKSPCSCGRQHPLIDSVYGRPSNLLRLGKADWMRPALASEEVEKHLPDCRWQLVQTAPKPVELRYMRYPGNSAVAATGARRYVKSLIDPTISVAVREVAALGPSAGGKFPAFISELS
jgi:phenylacetate-CoA ligase